MPTTLILGTGVKYDWKIKDPPPYIYYLFSEYFLPYSRTFAFIYGGLFYAIALAYVYARVVQAWKQKEKITYDGVFGAICIYFYLIVSFLSFFLALYRIFIDAPEYSPTQYSEYKFNYYYYVVMAVMVIADVMVTIPFFRDIEMDWYWVFVCLFLAFRWIQWFLYWYKWIKIDQ